MAFAGRKIWIVEDDPVTRDLLKVALEAEGYQVLLAANGTKFLNIIKADPPDAIILDIMLPWIDGYELCRAIKSNEELAAIPTIFISARAAKNDIEKGLACGADAYFTKPFNLAQIAAKLDELISRRGVNS